MIYMILYDVNMMFIWFNVVLYEFYMLNTFKKQRVSLISLHVLVSVQYKQSRFKHQSQSFVAAEGLQPHLRAEPFPAKEVELKRRNGGLEAVVRHLDPALAGRERWRQRG